MITTVAGTVAAIFGAITAVSSAWPTVDPYFLAHRGYVVEKVGGVQQNVNELLVWKTEDAKARNNAEYEAWTIQLQREQDPQAKALIQQRLLTIQREQQQLDERINSIKSR